MKDHSCNSSNRFRFAPQRRFAVCLMAAMLGLALPTPGRAEVHGGIEIGAKGVKATVIDVADGADGYEVKILLSGTKNTTLTAGLAAANGLKPCSQGDERGGGEIRRADAKRTQSSR